MYNEPNSRSVMLDKSVSFSACDPFAIVNIMQHQNLLPYLQEPNFIF